MFRDARQELERLQEQLQQPEPLPFEEEEQTARPEQEDPRNDRSSRWLLQVILLLCMALVVTVGLFCVVFLLWLRSRGLL